MEKKYWIIDTDGGIDDCQALVLALTNPEIEIVAITTVSGNVDLSKVNKNIAETLRISNKTHIPYYSGCQRPLISNPFYAEAFHGKDGINGYWDNHIPQDLPLANNKTAAEAIVEYANLYRGKISIVNIAPLTNLAVALALDPALPEKFDRVVVMGGSTHGEGNDSITAEFNFYVDPEAAYIVLDRFPLIELIPWDTCMRPESILSMEFIRLYSLGTTQIGSFISEITKSYDDGELAIFCDSLAVAIAIDPSVALKKVLKYGTIELAGTLTRGMSVVEWRDERVLAPDLRKNLQIVELVDLAKLSELLLNSIK